MERGYSQVVKTLAGDYERIAREVEWHLAGDAEISPEHRATMRAYAKSLRARGVALLSNPSN